MLPAASAPLPVDRSAPADGPSSGFNTSGALALVGIATLLAVTLAHPSATRLHTWPWAAIVALLWLLPVAVLMMRVASAHDLQLPHPALSAGLLLLGVAAVGSAWLSPFASASLGRTWPTLGGVAYCFLLHDWLAGAKARLDARIAAISIIVGVAGAALIIVSLAMWWPDRASSRNTVPFGHSTYTGGAIVLLLPWFVLRVWHPRAWQRLAWSASALGAVAVLVGTSSRGAVLAVGLVAGIAAIATLFLARWPRHWKLLVLAGAVGLGLVATLANPRLRELMLERRWSEGAQASNRQRAAMLVAGFQLGLERPWLGWGPGTVPLAYPRVRAQLDGGVENVLQLHNTPVQLWATLGLAGILSLVLLGGGTGRLILAIRRLPPGGARAANCAAVASLGGYAAFALTDHQFDLPFFAAFAATNLAVLTASNESGRTTSLRPPRRFLILLAISGVVAGPAFAAVRDLMAHRVYDQALAAAESGRSEDYIATLDHAARLAPHDPFFFHQAADAQLRAATAASDAARRRELTRSAIARLEASLTTEAHQELAHFNLAWLRLGHGDAPAAARHFIAAARLVPDKGGVYFGLGLALQEQERREDAIRAFALEWLNDPQHMTSPAWEVPALAKLRPAIYADVLHLYGELRKTRPDVARVEAWTRWWHGETVSEAALGEGFNRATAALAGAFPTIAEREPVALQFPWAKLYAAWSTRDFAALAASDREYLAALTRRAERHAMDFRAFLTSGTEDEPALVTMHRRGRTGYGVLAFHPEGPVLHDVYVVQENRLVADFAAELFPAKGWLPGRFLLALLPQDSR